jgi:hypothetical protein
MTDVIHKESILWGMGAGRVALGAVSIAAAAYGWNPLAAAI